MAHGPDAFSSPAAPARAQVMRVVIRRRNRSTCILMEKVRQISVSEAKERFVAVAWKGIAAGKVLNNHSSEGAKFIGFYGDSSLHHGFAYI